MLETVRDANPWGISFMAMFHMSNDSHLFFDHGGPDRLPLYEAKMIHQFDHRWATYEASGESRIANGEKSREVTSAEKADPSFTVRPRYWVAASEVEARLRERGWNRRWLMGWRDICRATEERTVIAAVVPRVGLGTKCRSCFVGWLRLTAMSQPFTETSTPSLWTMLPNRKLAAHR